MRALLAITLFIVGASCVPLLDSHIESEWIAFKQHYRSQAFKGRTANEEPLRRQIFANNLRFIESHNAEADNGVHSYRLGVNQFADMTDVEYRQYLNIQLPLNGANVTFGEVELNSAAPASIDWRQKNVVTHVKNQGQCGSCFAFCAVDSIESHHAIKTGQLVTLAPQQVVDCIHTGGDVCKTGGDPVNVMRLVINEGGLERESDYPYTAHMGSCHFQKAKVAVHISGYQTLQTGQESALQNAVGTAGPVAIAIDAGHDGFRFYKSGVYVESACHKDISHLNHGVLAVGYGSEGGKDYWLIKNSWATTYGDHGYIKMARNHNNQCGVATYGVYPTGA